MNWWRNDWSCAWLVQREALANICRLSTLLGLTKHSFLGTGQYGQKLVALSMVVLQLWLPVKAAETPIDLDLTSTARTLTPGHLADSQSITIQTGETQKTVTAGTLLTPAERLAVYQVFSTGQQSILLGQNGDAIGGTFTMGPKFNQYVSSVVIPQGVTAIRDFGTASALNLSGNLTNAGNFYAASTNSAVNTAVINAANIFNQPGALLTSVLPSGGLSGFTNAISGMNLTLNVVNNIVNAGVISSAGNLTAVAGGSIINALSMGVTGPSPLMQAANNINLISANITNSGTISALAGNINVASLLSSNILISNLGGRLEALAGSINVRDALFGAQSDLEIKGGDLIAKEINLYSGVGKIKLDLNNIVGTLNTLAAEVQVQASTNTLTLGNISVKGDPTFFNDAGGIQITGDIEVGEDLSIIASGDITTAPGVQFIRARDVNGQGYNINMIAGANITSGTGSTGSVAGAPPAGSATSDVVVANGASATGGSIDFYQSPNLLIDSSSTCSGCVGGGINLVALAHDNGDGTTSGGWIGMQPHPGTPGLITINALGNGANGGNVFVAANAIVPADFPRPAFIALGNIITDGQVTVSASQADFGNGLTFATNGTMTGTIAAGPTMTSSYSPQAFIDVSAPAINVSGQWLLEAPAGVRLDTGNLVMESGSSLTVNNSSEFDIWSPGSPTLTITSNGDSTISKTGAGGILIYGVQSPLPNGDLVFNGTGVLTITSEYSVTMGASVSGDININTVLNIVASTGTALSLQNGALNIGIGSPGSVASSSNLWVLPSTSSSVVNVGANSTLHADGNLDISNFNGPTGSVTITNNGTISAGFGGLTMFVNDTLTLNNEGAGIVQTTGWLQISHGNTSLMTININNSGTGQIQSNGTVRISIFNNSPFTINTSGINVSGDLNTFSSGDLTLSNTGTIRVGGVFSNDNNQGANFTLTNNGIILTGGDFWNNSTGSLTLTNSGTITANGGNFTNSSVANLALGNTGIISAIGVTFTSSGGDATLDNNNSIIATGNGQFDFGIQVRAADNSMLVLSGNGSYNANQVVLNTHHLRLLDNAIINFVVSNDPFSPIDPVAIFSNGDLHIDVPNTSATISATNSIGFFAGNNGNPGDPPAAGSISVQGQGQLTLSSTDGKRAVTLWAGNPGDIAILSNLTTTGGNGLGFNVYNGAVNIGSDTTSGAIENTNSSGSIRIGTPQGFNGSLTTHVYSGSTFISQGGISVDSSGGVLTLINDGTINANGTLLINDAGDALSAVRLTNNNSIVASGDVGISTRNGQALTITNYGSFSSGASIDISGGGDVSITNTGNGTNSGLITTTGTSISIGTFGGNTTLAVDPLAVSPGNNPTISVTGAGDPNGPQPQILIFAEGGAVDINASYTLDAGTNGFVVIETRTAFDGTPAGPITLAAGQTLTVAGDSRLNIATPLFILELGALLTSDTNKGIPFNPDIVISSAFNNAGFVVTNNGVISGGGSVVFSNFNPNGAIEINNFGVIQASNSLNILANGNVTINNAGDGTNTGLITTTGTLVDIGSFGGSINLSSQSGTPTISLSGSCAGACGPDLPPQPTISLFASGGSVNINSSYVFDAGPTGDIRFESQDSFGGPPAGPITIAAGQTLSVTGQSRLFISTPRLIVSSGATIMSDGNLRNPTPSDPFVNPDSDIFITGPFNSGSSLTIDNQGTIRGVGSIQIGVQGSGVDTVINNDGIITTSGTQINIQGNVVTLTGTDPAVQHVITVTGGPAQFDNITVEADQSININANYLLVGSNFIRINPENIGLSGPPGPGVLNVNANLTVRADTTGIEAATVNIASGVTLYGTSSMNIMPHRVVDQPPQYPLQINNSGRLSSGGDMSISGVQFGEQAINPVTIDNNGIINVGANLVIYSTGDVTVTASSLLLGQDRGTVTSVQNTLMVAEGLIRIEQNAISAGQLASGVDRTVLHVLTPEQIQTAGEIALLSNAPLVQNQINNVITINNVILTSTGANISITAANTINMGSSNFAALGGNLVVMANNTVAVNASPVTFKSVAQYTATGYVGGGIGVYAGTDIPLDHRALSDMMDSKYQGDNRTASGTYASEGSITGDYSYNTLHGGTIWLRKADTGNMSMPGTSLVADGGVLWIDPPGNVFLNGANFLAVAPPLFPPPCPGCGGPPPPELRQDTFALLEQPALPGLGERVPTDVETLDDPFINSTVGYCGFPAALNPFGNLPAESAVSWVISTDRCQPIYFEDDDGLIVLGAPGSIFEPQSDRTLLLKEGMILAIAGENGLVVMSPRGKATIPAGSPVAVEQEANGALKLNSLHGLDVEITFGEGENAKTFTAAAGEDIVITDEVGAKSLPPGFTSEPAGDASRFSNGSWIFKGRPDLGKMLQFLSMCDYYCLPQHKRKRFEDLRHEAQLLNSTVKVPASEPSEKSNVPLSDSSAVGKKISIAIDLRPISYQREGKAQESNGLQTVKTGGTVIKATALGARVAVNKPNLLTLSDGQILVSAEGKSTIKAGSYTIELDSDTLTLVSKDGEMVAVNALWAKRANAIRAFGKGPRVNILEGQEIILGPTAEVIQQHIKANTVARRNIRGYDFPDGQHLSCAEFSFVSLIQNTELLSRLSKSKDDDDRALVERMIRMAACVHYVTRSHGAYAILGLKE